jgi:hypothetical protein
LADLALDPDGYELTENNQEDQVTYMSSNPANPPKPSEKTIPATSRWKNGSSGDPAGRPVGSRNKSTLFLEALLEDEAEPLTRKMIQSALKGDPMALRSCGERLLPRRKGRPIQLPLQNLTQASALKSILTAVGEGEITPEEGEIVANIVAKQAPLEVEDLKRRISALEKSLAKAWKNTNPERTPFDRADEAPQESEIKEDSGAARTENTEPEATTAAETNAGKSTTTGPSSMGPSSETASGAKTEGEPVVATRPGATGLQRAGTSPGPAHGTLTRPYAWELPDN